MDKQEFKQKARRAIDPLIVLLAASGIPPILISLIGLVLGLYGALQTGNGSLFLGGIFLIISGICDVVDGALARRQNIVSRFGAFIDSTFDRVSEFAYFGAILYYYVDRIEGFNSIQVIVVLTALAGSVLTSYARARAEGLGLACSVGLLERPERIAVLTLGLLLGSRVLIVALVFLAVSTMLTFFQRIYHVYNLTK